MNGEEIVFTKDKGSSATGFKESRSPGIGDRPWDDRYEKKGGRCSGQRRR